MCPVALSCLKQREIGVGEVRNRSELTRSLVRKEKRVVWEDMLGESRPWAALAALRFTHDGKAKQKRAGYCGGRRTLPKQ